MSGLAPCRALGEDGVPLAQRAPERRPLLTLLQGLDVEGEAELDPGGEQLPEPAGEGLVGQGAQAERLLVAAVEAQPLRPADQARLGQPLAQGAQVPRRDRPRRGRVPAPGRVGARPDQVEGRLAPERGGDDPQRGEGVLERRGRPRQLGDGARVALAVAPE